MSVIEVKGLHFYYPKGNVHALRGVNLSIEAGESVAIIGRNGSGKTTLVKHFNGLLQSAEGQVFVNGALTDGKEPAELATQVGLVFQNPDDQVFSTRVDDEISFGPNNLNLSPEEVGERINKSLAITGLENFRETHPYDLTITERKLLCLASILAMEPPIIVLDEPTTAQDQIGVRKLGKIVESILSEGKTVITISHDMDFVAEFFRRTIVMRQGEIILDGPTEDVFSQVELLKTTYVKPSPMALLGQEINAPKHAITVDTMASWVKEEVRRK